jgi:hypothetical protein
VLRPTSDVFTIEDAYFDDVTVLPLGHICEPSFQLVEWYARLRAEVLDIEYFEALPIHNFPIEELVGDATSEILVITYRTLRWLLSRGLFVSLMI